MQHREYVRTDGREQSVGPVHFSSRGVLLVNRTLTDAVFFDDAGNEYDCPARVAVTYPLDIPTSRVRGRTVAALAAGDTGTLSVTITDAETILSTAQLARIALNPVTEKVVTGFVNIDGSVLDGTGYTCLRNALGDYSITFTVPFASRPSVLVTVSDGTVGASVTGVLLSGSIAKTGFRLLTYNSATGAARDQLFEFVAREIV